MDFYRIMLTKDRVRRVIDLNLQETQIVTLEARQDGWQVTSVLLPRGAELMPGILEETTDLPMN
jgi:hypothetical protein